MSMDSALAEIMKNVPEWIATGWVDTTTGALRGLRTMDGQPREGLDQVAAATADLFRSASLVAIEDRFQAARGATRTEPYVREIIVMSQNLIHVFVRGRQRDDQVLIVVTDVSANLGTLIARARGALSAVEAAR